MSSETGSGAISEEASEILRQLAAKGPPAPSAGLRRPAADALVYAIEGEIGAGKTELAKGIAAKLRRKGVRVCLILEPVEIWRAVGILGKFYQSPSRHGYGFQTFVYATRVLAIAKAVHEDPLAQVYILERTPATDLIFMELQRGLVDSVEMEMYHTWCRTYDLLLPIDLKSARVLYLRTSIDVCMSRIGGRQRAGEIAEDGRAARDGSATGGVTVEYQQRLRRAHEQFLHLAPPSGEFPHLPESPFERAAVFDIKASIADQDFRETDAGQNAALDAIIGLMGLGGVLK